MTTSKNQTTPADERWRGKRYVCLVRQSNDSDGTTSTEAQLKWLKNEGERLGMTHVDDIVLNGISGSLPGKRQDLEDLIDRKRDRDDFDVLLVQRLDRLTRGGSGHGMWFRHECERVGIELMLPGDDLPTDLGGYTSIIEVAKLEAAREQAKSIGQRSVQGMMHALSERRSTVVSHTPYGLDRLYLSPDGKPLFRIRNLGDGRQHKPPPPPPAPEGDHDKVIDTYGQVGGGSKGHYRKQKHECVQLVAGDPAKAAVVKEIFQLHYRENLGGRRIAQRLNSRGVLSPTGKTWGQRQVESLYENPVYCGIALGRKVKQSIYYSHGENHPEATQLDPKAAATCQYAPRELRAPRDWVWQKQPLLIGFLPEDLAEFALAKIRELHVARYERSQDPTTPTRSPSKHKNSEYVLTGLLVAKQDGADLTGTLNGRVGKKKRYYRHRRGRTESRKGSVYNKQINAEPLERAVMGLITEVVQDAPQLRQRVLDTITADRAQQDGATGPSAQELEEQREQITQRLRTIAQSFDVDSLEDLKPQIKRLQDQRKNIDAQLAAKQRAAEASDEDPEQIADEVLARLGDLDTDWDTLTPTARRELVTAFVAKVEVDMATKDAEVVLKLLSWALKGDAAMRPANSSPSSTVRETHRVIRLDWARCRYVHNQAKREVRYCCRRKPAA